MGIIRGLKIYDVGLAVANPTLGITVENWASGDISILTIDESEDRFYANWDSGFTIKSDMRNYPKEPSGSGGVITINDDGWYSTFLSSGYNLEGCRIERNWVENGDKMLSQYFIYKVKQGIGFITLSLLSISCQMASDITGAGTPLIVGDWENAELEQVGESVTPLFGGMTFRQSEYNVVYTYDRIGAPLTYGLRLIPTDPTFDLESFPFPENTLIRVVAGVGEGIVMSINQVSIKKDCSNVNGCYYSVTALNDYGVYTNDDAPTGIAPNIDDVETMLDLSIFEFVVADQKYLTDTDSTISNVKADGSDITNYTVDSGVVTLDTQDQGSSVKMVTVDNNDTYDMTGFTEQPSEKDGSRYYGAGEGGSGNAGFRVDDRKLSTRQTVSSQGLAGYSYEVTDDVTDTKGVCVHAKITTTEAVADGVFYVVAVGVWGVDDSEWLSEKFEEVISTVEINYSIEGGGTFEKEVFIRNFGNQYYLDTDGSDPTNDPWDNRDLTEPSGGNFDLHIRGRDRFEHTNGDILQARPDKVYLLVYSTLLTRDATPRNAPLTLQIAEVAFFGESDNTPVVEGLTADITGRDWGNMGQAITNVATEMDWSKFENVSIDVPVLPSFVRGYISSAKELKTDVALQRLHRESWTVGYLDKTGTYKVTDVSGKIGSGDPVASTHDFVLPNGYMLKDEILNYEADGLPTGGTIQYSRTSSGGFQKSITITGAEQETYDSSYVTGVTDSSKAEELWNICRGIFLKTGVLYDVRKDMQELWWLYQEDDAVQYFTNILEWNGGSDFIRNVIQLDVDVADIDSSGDVLPWIIGDACNVTIPNITGGALSGVVTGVKYNKEDESAVVSCRVGDIVPRADTITELGNIIGDTITELDTNIDTITEVGLV